ncbi:hypothetical protein O3M35_008798 [Rhynocoris fuscipes]|uniref:3-hydroxy-3-methylglutaryl coenzyme A reductase n=1 Tax=Rhynocoris fuscipes TaxID=488301 RepID=A0AAW1D924_9HEMI
MFSIYRIHGEFCASHPWEVIVATLTLTACIFSIDSGSLYTNDSTNPLNICHSTPCQDYNAVDAIVMTAIRCIAIIYSYYQFCNLRKLGSKYILGIAGLFTVFSSFVFTSSIINFLQGDLSDLKDALFFFLLLIDLSKATLLAQFALCASTQEEVKNNIALGVELLGPSLTLDTLVETLVISVGTLCGIRRLEILSYFACMSVIINYVVFMTFFPACLSLILELVHTNESAAIYEMHEQGQKPNPVLQRVKIIMAFGLVIVHLNSRWAIVGIEDDDQTVSPFLKPNNINFNETNDSEGFIMKCLRGSVDNIVVLILLLALIIKFIYFEDSEQVAGYIFDIQTKTEKEKLSEIPSTQVVDKSVQTLVSERPSVPDLEIIQEDVDTEYISNTNNEPRSLQECLFIYENEERGIGIRRTIISSDFTGLYDAMKELPYENYDYSKVLGACCENVIGYVPVPVGMAGPLLLDGKLVYVPMATTEGCLVASTNRGCKALLENGVTTRVVADGMTRGPVVRFDSITRASEAMHWIQVTTNFDKIKESFDSTSRFAKLIRIQVRIAGRYLFIRFVATTGDAMGMNMVSKATEASLNYVKQYFKDMEILSLSGNFCSDKKPAAINWIEGRGKYVVCEAIVSAKVVKEVLKTTVQALVDLNISKNLVGSAVAGSIGGFNAHAANIVTAIYIATGQDPAQNVSSSNCLTLIEPWGDQGKDLYVSCTMPSIEIGTVGGGTQLGPQSACLDILGVKGAHKSRPGENAAALARIICGSVLAGELSLLSALSAGHLVKSHLKHNRSSANITDTSETVTHKKFGPCLSVP